MEKARRRRNFERYEKLKAEQQAMTKYQPEMLHSPADNTKRIVFHPQLLSDFDAICDLAKRMNEALNTEPRQTIERFPPFIGTLTKMYNEMRHGKSGHIRALANSASSTFLSATLPTIQAFLSALRRAIKTSSI